MMIPTPQDRDWTADQKQYLATLCAELWQAHIQLQQVQLDLSELQKGHQETVHV